MPKLVNTFVKGVMNKDVDYSLITQDTHVHAENLRFSTNKGNDGIGKNIKGTLEVSNATEGSLDFKCISAYFDKNTDSIFYCLATTSGAISKIVQYNINTGITTEVLSDDRGVLNFNKNGYITGINEIGGLLLISEWGNNPRRINIERAKSYGKNNFTEEDIALMVKPPLNKIKLTLRGSDTTIQKENNLKEKMFAFSYRYRYLDGEYSTLAPFTNFAFRPKSFDYDFATQSNKSMVNSSNQALLEFNTGSKLVSEIQLVFKESDTLQAYIIDDFNKALLGWGDDQTQAFAFDNLKSIRALPKEVLRNNYSNIPITAKGQTLIDGRLMLANYLEGYDIVDSNNNKIKIDYKLELESKDLTTALNPEPTVKSIRDYEVVIVYKDKWLRETTALSSKTNTIFTRQELATKSNSIHVVLKSKPPVWAEYYQFFIRQNGKDYDQILPITFYEDGAFRWVKIETSDLDKIKEGDILYVKSDSRGLITDTVRVKVLEIATKDRNFLETSSSVTTVEQLAGTYFKIKPEGFSMQEQDLSRDEYQGYFDNSGFNDVIRNNVNYIEKPVYYGTTGLNDLTSSGTNTNNTDIRFLIEIDSIGDGTTTFNTFKWSIDGGANYVAQNVDITASTPQVLSDGVEITFNANTGHVIGDKWIVGAKAARDDGLGDDEDGWTYSLFQGPATDRINPGATISLTYDEYGDEKLYIQQTFVSTTGYSNLEEWFYGDNIDNFFVAEGIPLSKIWFRRGVCQKIVGFSEQIDGIEIKSDGTGTMNMIMRSKGYENSNFDDTAKVKTKITITQSDVDIILETEPKDSLPEIFYEIGQTYKIENGFHLANTAGVTTDQDQTATQDARIKLDWFNAWTFGNGVESYKVYDGFNQKGLDEGVRVTTRIKEEYKQVYRDSDITWSDVYNSDSNFNGLSAFNASLLNWITLDEENGSIQKLHNSNGNLMVLQEEGVGLVPYNKNIIYDTQGGSIVGISTNILDKKSYRPYAQGKIGISKNPESFVSIGSRNYFTDKQRGNLIRLSIDGVTEINAYGFEYEFSDLMVSNKQNMLIGGFDPKHKEYLLYLPSEKGCLTYIDNSGNKGFPEFQTFEPDFLLGADNEFYSWKNGIMYKHNASDTRNSFYGIEYPSKIKFVVNHNFGTDKIYNNLGINSTHKWSAKLKTQYTAREIPLDSFVKQNEYWFSEIMGNTNDDVYNNNVFGIGTYPIVNGEITISYMPDGISVGDKVLSTDSSFNPEIIDNINGNVITLHNPVNLSTTLLMFSKNQNIDGANIKGNFMEVELTNNDTEEVEIRSVKTEAIRNINT